VLLLCSAVTPNVVSIIILYMFNKVECKNCVTICLFFSDLVTHMLLSILYKRYKPNMPAGFGKLCIYIPILEVCKVFKFHFIRFSLSTEQVNGLAKLLPFKLSHDRDMVLDS